MRERRGQRAYVDGRKVYSYCACERPQAMWMRGGFFGCWRCGLELRPAWHEGRWAAERTG